MNLKFLVNKEYTFLHAFNQNQKEEPFKEWGNFTLAKWEKFPHECYLLAGFPEWPLLSKIPLKTLAVKAEKLIKKWIEEPEPRKLIKETREYRNWLQKEWDKKGKKTLKELEKIIKFPLPRKTISVYITHPKLKNGMAISPEIIVWGHKEEWQNYSIVYLCHEILHTIFWGDNSKITHAIIELATDQELRIRLNKTGEYFDYVGHKELLKIEKKLFPFWKKYLMNKKQNLRQFIEIQKANNYTK